MPLIVIFNNASMKFLYRFAGLSHTLYASVCLVLALQL